MAVKRHNWLKLSDLTFIGAVNKKEARVILASLNYQRMDRNNFEQILFISQYDSYSGLKHFHNH